jgi:hypothetical protein
MYEIWLYHGRILNEEIISPTTGLRGMYVFLLQGVALRYVFRPYGAE